MYRYTGHAICSCASVPSTEAESASASQAVLAPSQKPGLPHKVSACSIQPLLRSLPPIAKTPLVTFSQVFYSFTYNTNVQTVDRVLRKSQWREFHLDLPMRITNLYQPSKYNTNPASDPHHRLQCRCKSKTTPSNDSPQAPEPQS